MASFLAKNRKHKFRVLNHSLLGRVGFSITEESIIDLAGSLFAHGLKSSIKEFVIAYGNRTWALTFAETLCEALTSLCYTVIIPDKPCTLSETSWLLQQSKTPQLGIYLSNSVMGVDELKIDFLDDKGSPISSKEFNLILKSQSNFKQKELEDSTNIQYKHQVTLSGYAKYLKNTRQLPAITPQSQIINVDCMFGSSEYVLELVAKEALLPTRRFNAESDAPRLEGYRSNPTGNYLKWYSTFSSLKDDRLLFAVDSAGERIGLYDLVQQTELSIDSLAILLILAAPAKTGKVILSQIFSKTVHQVAKKSGFNVQVSDKPLPELHPDIVLHADGLGGFITQGFPVPNPLSSIIQISNLITTLNKSPGEIIDSYQNTFKTKSTALAIYKSEEFLVSVAGALAGKKKTKDGVITVSFDNNTKSVFKFDPLQNLGIVKLEAQSNEDLNNLRKSVEGSIVSLL